MPVFSYGTMPSEHGPRRAGGFRSMRLVAMVLLSSAALVTLLALARGPTPQSSRRWLLQTMLPLDSGPVFPPPRTPATETVSADPLAVADPVAQATPDEVGSEPTEKDSDVASFIIKASLDILMIIMHPSCNRPHTFPVSEDYCYQ
jgi:hypothetical protein